jgi:hypothetical protein
LVLPLTKFLLMAEAAMPQRFPPFAKAAQRAVLLKGRRTAAGGGGGGVGGARAQQTQAKSGGSSSGSDSSSGDEEGVEVEGGGEVDFVRFAAVYYKHMDAGGV